MDVTQFVQEADVRPIIDSLYPKPLNSIDAAILAPPQTTHYAEVGSAFDYLFSFWLIAHNPATDVRRWPARAGLTRIATEYPAYEHAASDALDAAETALAEYLETGQLKPTLAESALDLARIEAAYKGDSDRAVELLDAVGSYNEGDVRDLLQLYDVIPDEFTTFDTVRVNPEFGPVEHGVRGVDVDCLCDGCLVTVKTTKQSKFSIIHWRSLVVFATLAEASRRADERFSDETTLPEITQVGLYFARHGYLWTYPTDDIYTHPSYKNFRNWLLPRLRQYSSNSS
jgi:hypothetical protein